MSRVPINKSSLAHERKQLKLFKKFLPSLDLKRQQLLTEQKKAQDESRHALQHLEDVRRRLEPWFKPLGAYDIELTGLVRVDSVDLVEQNVVGARLPVVQEIHFAEEPYSLMAKPFWVDFLVQALKLACEAEIRAQVASERVDRLNRQVRRITQRVNLFEKILIPSAQSNIKRIQLGLSEQERSAVVRSKLAKRKNQQTVSQSR